MKIGDVVAFHLKTNTGRKVQFTGIYYGQSGESYLIKPTGIPSANLIQYAVNCSRKEEGILAVEKEDVIEIR